MAEIRSAPGTKSSRSIAVPDGWIVEAVTFLEMLAPAALRPEPDGRALALQRIQPDAEGYRSRFRRVGQDWLWRGRLVLADAELLAIIGRHDVEIYDLVREETIIGLLELDFRVPGECEIAYFGVTPEAIGGGAGRYLMNRAIERAWSGAPQIRRLFVHTCSNDHPGALSFYRRSGFVPYGRAVELYPDPRGDGTLPVTAAPQIPLIGS